MSNMVWLAPCTTVSHTVAHHTGVLLQPKVPRPKDSAGLANIDLSTKLRGFYQSPAHADIQLRAGSEVFPAHKIVLAAQSPTFERMFESGMVEQVRPAPLPVHQPLISGTPSNDT